MNAGDGCNDAEPEAIPRSAAAALQSVEVPQYETMLLHRHTRTVVRDGKDRLAITVGGCTAREYKPAPPEVALMSRYENCRR